jgi:serine phosphatase RsbU (regulator of sigma subunit)
MASLEITHAPAFAVIDPDGDKTRQEISEFPFCIGRQAGNHLIIRDARASRRHARLIHEDGDYILEDLQSRHGVFVNGERIGRKPLQDGDRVEFGFSDSFCLVFERPGSRVAEIADQLTGAGLTDRTGSGGNLARLRAVLEVSRALQNSFSVDGVLAAVVDAALVVTRAERGFLFTTEGDRLKLRCGRDHAGPLHESDLRVPRNLIRKALDERANTFSIQFDPFAGDPAGSAYALDLKSVVCIPLVRIRMGADSAEPPSATGDAVGVLYLDSRSEPRDMTRGNRELLETLGIEASTVLENARLLEEERARHHMQEELAIARSIQQSLLPNALPQTGWLRAAGYSMPSRQVGGDYYDVIRLSPDSWGVVIADVAGKGVSSALVASLLQGAFLAIAGNPESLRHTLARLNAFFLERTEGRKHATLFCAVIERDGRMRYVNAGHCAPILVTLHDAPETLPATAPPVGLLEGVTFDSHERTLHPGDRLVLFTDGVTEAQNARGDFFGAASLTALIASLSDRPCGMLHQAVLEGIDAFTGGVEQADDLTLAVLEFRPD